MKVVMNKKFDDDSLLTVEMDSSMCDDIQEVIDVLDYAHNHMNADSVFKMIVAAKRKNPECLRCAALETALKAQGVEDPEKIEERKQTDMFGNKEE